MKKQRRCPLCAEVVKAEATKCRSCGSTLGALGAEWSGAEPKGQPAAEVEWPAEPAPGDVGAPGLAVLGGALLGYGVGAWLDPAVHPLLTIVGAAVGGGLAAALRRS